VASDSAGSENIGVLRVRDPVLNEGSFVGGIVTTRATAGHHNVVYGTDAVVRPFGNEYITAQWAQSVDDRFASGLSASQARVQWQRRSSKEWIYFVNVKWSGRDFNPGLGFESHTDYTQGEIEFDYNWIGKSGYSLQPSLFTYAYRRNGDGALDQGELYPYVDFGTPSGLRGWVAWRGHDEDLTSSLSLSPAATVPSGRHQYQQGELYVVSPPGSKFGYTLLSDIGGFYDGRQAYVDFAPTWSMSPHLSLGGEYELNRVAFPSRSETLNADVARLKILAAWNSRLSAQTFIQYSHDGHLAVGNLRLRYQFREGNDLYVMYNDQLNTDRARVLPESIVRHEIFLYVREVGPADSC
jgi:hypothetical protein